MSPNSIQTNTIVIDHTAQFMAKTHITCKLTGDIGPGVDAHVIPRAFYSLKDEDGNFRKGGTVITLKGKQYVESKRPIGVYDSKIVTANGEKCFEACDNYAARFFLQDYDQKPWCRSLYNKNVDTLSSDHFDPGLIRRFCMTVLWRSHATSQPFFANVNLGPHEPRLRKLILEGDVGDPNDFSIILSGWSNIKQSSWPVMAPSMIKVRGLTFYRFRTSGIVFHIKVDKRPFPSEDLESVVGGSHRLAVIQRKFYPTEADEELLKVIQNRNQESARE